MLLPSSIQRAEDLVGMAMPTVGLPWARAPIADVAATAAASATADSVVFRLIMLHSLFLVFKRLRVSRRARGGHAPQCRARRCGHDRDRRALRHQPCPARPM